MCGPTVVNVSEDASVVGSERAVRLNHSTPQEESAVKKEAARPSESGELRVGDERQCPREERIHNS